MVSVLRGGKHDRAPVPLLDFRCMLRGNEDQIRPSDRSERPFGVHAGLCCLLHPILFRLTADGTESWYGVTRALLFAVLVLVVTSVLARFRFRLRL